MDAREKLRRQHAARAVRETKRRQEAAGPLFATLVEEVSAEEMRRRWFANKSRAAESCGTRWGLLLLSGLITSNVREYARSALPSYFEGLDAYARRVWLCPEYWYGFWKEVLTSGRVERPGVEGWPVPGYVPPLGEEEFYSLFPYSF